MTITLRPEPPTSPTATLLTTALSAELSALYNDDGGASGATPDSLQGERTIFIVAWADDKAMGCGAVRPMANEQYAEIKRMYVEPAWRGRGISRQILIALETYAREMGYLYAQLETGVRQPEAMGLYESAGYVRIPSYGHYAEDELSVCYLKQL